MRKRKRKGWVGLKLTKKARSTAGTSASVQ